MKLFRLNGAQVEADIDGLPEDKEHGHYYRITEHGEVHLLDYKGESYSLEKIVLDETNLVHQQIRAALDMGTELAKVIHNQLNQ